MSSWLILIPLGVFGGFIAFVWHRLAIAPGWRRRWVRYAVAAVLVVLTVFAFAGFDVWGGSFTPAQMRPVAWLGQAFLASCLYLFLGLVPVWLASVAIWLVRWRHDDHGRSARRRLNAIASPLVAAVAVGVDVDTGEDGRQVGDQAPLEVALGLEQGERAGREHDDGEQRQHRGEQLGPQRPAGGRGRHPVSLPDQSVGLST